LLFVLIFLALVLFLLFFLELFGEELRSRFEPERASLMMVLRSFSSLADCNPTLETFGESDNEEAELDEDEVLLPSLSSPDELQPTSESSEGLELSLLEDEEAKGAREERGLCLRDSANNFSWLGGLGLRDSANNFN